jgi:glutaredoxin
MVTLYTTHCPQCRVVEAKLKQKNIEYNEVTDENKIKELGFLSVPVLQVENDFFLFKDAISWINSK